MCDVRQLHVIYRLIHLELKELVQIDVQEDLLARLERVESRLKTTTAINKRNINAVNNLIDEVRKLIE